MKNPLAKLFMSGDGILKEPGDKMSAEITPSGRKVMKIKTKEMNVSRTEYSTGKIVETKSFSKK